VKKPFLRKILSFGYRIILHLLLDTKIKDFPCGFKAVNKKVVEQIIPLVKNDQFFFDSEMLYLAEQKDFKIKEIPVTWVEPRLEGDSKVNLKSVSWRYFKEAWRMKNDNARNKITEKEKKFIWLVSLIMIVVTTLPVIYGYLIAGPLYYSGLHLWFLDGNVYLSYLNQVKDGNFLFVDLFSNEAGNIPIFNPFWLAVGLLGKILNLTAPLTFHLARIILIPIFLFVLYKFIADFLPDFSFFRKKLCFLFSIFASGLGGYYVLFKGLDIQNNNFPLDIWVPESVNFQIIFDTPHFIASITLLILILYYFFKAVDKGLIKYSIYAGLLSLVFFSFHPYYVMTIYAIPALYILVKFIRNKKIDYNHFLYYCLLVIISLPSVFYYAFLYLTNDFMRIKSAQNACGSSNPIGFFIGFGLTLFFAILIQVYFIIQKELTDKKIFLMIWFWGSILLMYCTVAFERRLSEGFQVPLVILSFMGLVMFYDILRSHWRFFRELKSFEILIVFIFLFCFSNIYIYAYSFRFIDLRQENVFLKSSTVEALDWYKTKTSQNNTLLCSFESGQFIPGLIGRRVYLGHGMETLNFEEKNSQVAYFFQDSANDTWKIDFLKINRIDYIYYSKREQVLGNFDPFAKNYLELVYENEAAAIFRVK
jgi:hypothetical protein